MKVKKFKGKTQCEVLQNIRKEFGESAVILKMEEINRNHPGHVSTDRFVITVAGNKRNLLSRSFDEEENTLKTLPVMEVSSPSVAEISRALSDNPHLTQTPPNSAMEEICANLLVQGMDSDFLEKIIQICFDNLRPDAMTNRRNIGTFINKILIKTLSRFDAQTKRDSRIKAFIGLSGAGKSTSIAKLAAAYYQMFNNNIVIITPKKYRCDRLRLIASQLNLTYFEVRIASEIEQIISLYKDTHLILIDTPSLTTNLSLLTSYLPERNDIEKHLVLKTDDRIDDLYTTIEIFRRFSYQKILFTNIDNTSQYARLLTLLLIADRPGSYLSNGEDLESGISPFSKEKLVELLNL